MPSPSHISALVVGVNQRRGREVSDRLREAGAVVVEAMTVPHAASAMRQLRFELIFVDFLGASVAMLSFLEIVRAMDPEARVFVFGPRFDCCAFEELPAAALAKLGFSHTQGSVDYMRSAGLEESYGQEHVGMRRQMAVPFRSTRLNRLQE